MYVINCTIIQHHTTLVTLFMLLKQMQWPSFCLPSSHKYFYRMIFWNFTHGNPWENSVWDTDLQVQRFLLYRFGAGAQIKRQNILWGCNCSLKTNRESVVCRSCVLCIVAVWQCDQWPVCNYPLSQVSQVSWHHDMVTWTRRVYIISTHPCISQATGYQLEI